MYMSSLFHLPPLFLSVLHVSYLPLHRFFFFHSLLPHSFNLYFSIIYCLLFFNCKNFLENLPSSPSSCSHLCLLMISFSCFLTLPVFYHHSSLETLHVPASDNQITVIDVYWFLKLTSLMTLDLSNNNVVQVL